MGVYECWSISSHWVLHRNSRALPRRFARKKIEFIVSNTNMFHPDILGEIIARLPKITALACVNHWLHARLHDHPELAFWRGYKTIADIYLRGIPKYLTLVHATPEKKLIRSALAGNLALVKHLCARVDPRADGDKLIQMVARNGHVAVAQYLVSVGADPRARNNFAIKCAAENGHYTVVKFLILVGAAPPRALV
jgi:hypothetical protein